MSKLVSIIVPVYNAEKYIARCIESILDQSFGDFELILVDDGSTDKSGEICDYYASTDERITIIHKENGGVSTARNAALDIIQGEFVIFVDGDDYIDKEYLTVMLSHMSDDIDMVVSKPQAVNPDTSINKYWKFNSDSSVVLEPTDLKNMYWEYRHFWVHCVLFRADLLKDIRFNPKYLVSQDTPFYCTAFMRCRKIKYIPEKLYYYVIFEESACHGKFNERKFTEIYAWQEIRTMFEGHPLYKEYLANYEMRCYRMYMLMLDAGMASDERTKMLLSEMRSNLKNGMHLNGYKLTFRIKFVIFSITPKALHATLHRLENAYIRLRSRAIGIVKKIIRH